MFHRDLVSYGILLLLLLVHRYLVIIIVVSLIKMKKKKKKKKIGPCLSDQIALASRVATCRISVIFIFVGIEDDDDDDDEEGEEEEDTLPPTRCPGLARKGVLNLSRRGWERDLINIQKQHFIYKHVYA